MKRIIISLLLFCCFVIACFAGDVRISTRDSIQNDTENDLWDDITEWLDSLFEEETGSTITDDLNGLIR